MSIARCNQGRGNTTSSSICKPEAGFTYIGLMFVIALMGLSLALAGTLWSYAQQREKERQLLFMGNQFIQAIGLYYQHSPGTIKRYPTSLADLIQDNRYVTTERYLRRIYKDPMTGTAQWAVIPAPEGGIMGVHSLSHDKTIKDDGFKSINRDFAGKKYYDDWQFVFRPNSNN